MTVLNSNLLTLGNYEKRVLLELDKELSWPVVQWIRLSDPRLKRTELHVFHCYVYHVPVAECCNIILKSYGIPLHKCVLEGVVELGYN